MPPRNLLCVAVTIVVSLACYSASSRNRFANLVAEAMDVVNTQALHEVPREQLFVSAMKGMLSDLDEHSMYISGDMFAAFDEDMRQEFGGVGMYVEVDPQTQQLVVLATMPGTPAFAANLRIGDQVVSIDGESILGLKRRESVKLLRGPIGEAVQLEILRGEQRLNKTLKRAVIAVSSTSGDFRSPDGEWKYVLESHPEIGYIRLSQFGEKSADEIRAAIHEAGEIKALVIDLRNNPGGLLNIAIEICDMFLPEDLIIVSTYGRDKKLLKGGQPHSTSISELDSGIPICILIDRNSASASEIVAGCLQDHGRAVLIGEQTWGKGTVQNVIPIQRNESALKLTTASYWRPSGKNIDRYDDISQQTKIWGVQPDTGFEVELTPQESFENIRQRNLRDIETLIVANGGDGNLIRSLESNQKAGEPGSDESKLGESESSSAQSGEGADVPDAASSDDSQPHVDRPLQRAIDYLESLSYR